MSTSIPTCGSEAENDEKGCATSGRWRSAPRKALSWASSSCGVLAARSCSSMVKPPEAESPLIGGIGKAKACAPAICASSRLTDWMMAKACCSGAGRSAQSAKDTKIVAASDDVVPVSIE